MSESVETYEVNVLVDELTKIEDSLKRDIELISEKFIFQGDLIFISHAQIKLRLQTEKIAILRPSKIIAYQTREKKGS